MMLRLTAVLIQIYHLRKDFSVSLAVSRRCIILVELHSGALIIPRPYLMYSEFSTATEILHKKRK